MVCKESESNIVPECRISETVVAEIKYSERWDKDPLRRMHTSPTASHHRKQHMSCERLKGMPTSDKTGRIPSCHLNSGSTGPWTMKPMAQFKCTPDQQLYVTARPSLSAYISYDPGREITMLFLVASFSTFLSPTTFPPFLKDFYPYQLPEPPRGSVSAIIWQ
jgi:hypothetical protein